MLVVNLVVGLEIDFAKVLITMIHKGAFKNSTTYPFVCLIIWD